MQVLSGRYNPFVAARVFPGTLHIKTMEFQYEMSNRSSQAFQEMAAMISQEVGALGIIVGVTSDNTSNLAF